MSTHPDNATDPLTPSESTDYGGARYLGTLIMDGFDEAEHHALHGNDHEADRSIAKTKALIARVHDLSDDEARAVLQSVIAMCHLTYLRARHRDDTTTPELAAIFGPLWQATPAAQPNASQAL